MKQKRKVSLEPWVVWRANGYRELTCPACHTHGLMEKQLDASPPFEPRKRYALFECSVCGTLHYPDARPFEYESRKDADIARKFYLEVGAGLDAMIAPLAWAEPEKVTSYLEVGGGYGFSVDFAARALGWRARNIDPSFIAGVGARDLGHDHIPEYLSADNPLPDGPFDRVLSSEVIEHVNDPDPFLAALASAVAPDGALVVTTPDAAAVTRDASLDALRPIIVAGHHLVIFTADGLIRALNRAGFPHVHVKTGDSTLYAVASRRPVGVDFTARPERSSYRAYLKQRRDSLAPDPALFAGFAVRHLKECVHSGSWDEANDALRTLTRRWQADFGFDMGRPGQIRPAYTEPETKAGRAIRDYAANYPFNLAIALFYAARLREHQGRTGEAMELYRACIRAAHSGQAVFESMFAACRETEDAAYRARLHIAALTSKTDPMAASGDLLALLGQLRLLPQDLWEATLFQVYAEGALTGRVDLVDGIRLIVQDRIEAKIAYDAPVSAAAGYAAAGLAQWSLAEEDETAARRWFTIARDAMTDAREYEVFADRLRGLEIPASRPARSSARPCRALIDAMQAADAEAARAPANEIRTWPEDAEALSASVAFAMGIYCLNHDGKPSEAAVWFDRSEQRSHGEERLTALFHKALAHKAAGEAEGLAMAKSAIEAAKSSETGAFDRAIGSRLAELQG
ncbi:MULTISPECIES: class I SAM-dependent methyltransferase [Hyphobacterium]|uniref:Methyltransferase domain-containing protein n=1 Tax=Hyphobacterium vulgare TaxID=1736751 RepID=A0ABV6ZV78_9PROT